MESCLELHTLITNLQPSNTNSNHKINYTQFPLFNNINAILPQKEN